MKLETFIRQQARVADSTVQLYVREARRFQGWLGTRPLNADAVQGYESWLKSRYKTNSLSNKVSGVNLYLKWKGTDLRIRRPPKEYNMKPRLVEDDEYEALLARITDPMERLAIRISYDSGWSPIDVVAIRVPDVTFDDRITVIRKARTKTRVAAEAVLLSETAAELRAHIKANPKVEYVFPGDRRKGRAHRNRTWVNAVLKRYGMTTFTPRYFRSNLATRWDGADIKGLMTQAGWSDPKTIYSHYRSNVRERQVESLERATGQAAMKRDPDDDTLPGYG